MGMNKSQSFDVRIDSIADERQVLEAIKNNARQLADEHNPIFRILVVLAAAIHITGANVERLVSLTGYEQGFVTEVARRMHIRIDCLGAEGEGILASWEMEGEKWKAMWQ